MKTFMYYLALILGAPIALPILKLKVSYDGVTKFKIPKGAIIISGHKSVKEAIAIAYLLFFRRLYFLAADWYHGFQIIFKPLMLLLGAVLVDLKGQNFNFIKKSQKLLNKGKNILVFPEGDYSENKKLFELGPFKTGYLLMAVESHAPVVPIMTDFTYGIFKRTRIIVGKPIYPILNQEQDSRAQLNDINQEIREKCLYLLYDLRKEKAKKVKMTYTFKNPLPGDVIRTKVGTYHHYGVYLSDDEVIEFGRRVNPKDEPVTIHKTSLVTFCNGQIPEVRIVKNTRKKRKIKDIISYSEEVLGKTDYSFQNNNCLDLANRLTLKI